MIRVLADRHHAGLFHSLQLLFARLGGEVYAPRGSAWWDEGYWRFGEGYGDNRLARQFLEGGWAEEGPTYDPEFPGQPIRNVFLHEARELHWDVVLASVPDNQAGYKRFADEVGAKFALSVGNTGQYVDWGLDPLVLNNSEMPMKPGSYVDIGQEFDSEHLFGFSSIHYQDRDGWNSEIARNVTSLANVMPQMPCWPLLDFARKDAPDLRFRIHGIDGPDGNLKPIGNIANAVRSAGWGWHDKTHGDGFGHVIHYFAAAGRPLIGHRGHYVGKRAEGLWEDGVTCIDLDRHPIEEALDLVREISADPERHNAMGRAIRDRFEAECNWEQDADNVGALLGLPVGYGLLTTEAVA